LVPGDIVEECMNAVLQTQKARDAQDPDQAKRKLFDAFSTIGVGVEQLKEYLGHGADVLSQKEVLDLRGLYSAIRDGETTWREVMDALRPTDVEDKSAPKSTSASVKEQVMSKSQQKRVAAMTAPAPESERGSAISPEEIWPKREPGE